MLIVRLDSVKALSNVLRDVDDLLPQRDLTSLQKKDLDEIALGCYNVLKKLEETPDKYQELESCGKGIREKSRRVWKRFQYNQGEIDQFQNQDQLKYQRLWYFSWTNHLVTTHSLFVIEKGAYLAQPCVLRNESRCRSVAPTPR
jgi:hypothetical protein